MRLAFTSDLHVEFQLSTCGAVADRVRQLRPDVFVVAGDVAPDLSLLRRSLEILAASVPRLLFLPGNHELWQMAPGAPGASERYLRVLPELTRSTGAEYLGLEPVWLEGIAFIGVTGWYDFSLRVPGDEVPLEAYRRGRYAGIECADRHFVVWRDGRDRLDDEELADWMLGRLRAQLRIVGSAPKVVVTHMLVGPEPLPATGVSEQDFVRGFLGDARLGEAVDRAEQVRYLISGHWHRPFRTERRGASGPYVWEGSPVGYPHEWRGDLREQVARAIRLVEL